MEYILALPEWDGEERIERFAMRVQTDFKGWPQYFHLWFRGMVSQGFYNQGLKLKDKDVVSVLIDLEDSSKIEFWVNGVPVGVLYDTLPQNTPLFFTFNAVNDSYLSANFGQNAFKYSVPTDYYPGFGVLKNPPPARGTLLTTYCKDFEQWGEYADGRFGTYDAKIKDNAPECGWRPPTPPTGTILGYKCIGFDRYAIVADGAGGSTDQLVGINHKDCGYTPPPPPEMTTAYFDKAFAGRPPKDSIQPFALYRMSFVVGMYITSFVGLLRA
jgi:hypothetical protein